MSTALTAAFASGVAGLSTDITTLLTANLAAIFEVAGILIAVSLVWRFARRAVGGR